MKTHNKYVYALKDNKITYFRGFSYKYNEKGLFMLNLKTELLKTNDAVKIVTNIQHLHVLCACDEDEKTGSMEATICNICGKSETY